MLPPGSEGRDEDAEGIFVCFFVNRFVCFRVFVAKGSWFGLGVPLQIP